ncbi:MAG: hypothetical protein GY809_17795 [Planctomycetes bacterium]|nr:hypothetical protein [Planctomycetota bacterium]
MRTDRRFCVIMRFWVVACCASLGFIGPRYARAQAPSANHPPQITSEKLSSGAISQVFTELADDLMHVDSLGSARYEQAMLYVLAAQDLNVNNRQAHQRLMSLVDRWPERDYSSSVLSWLRNSSHDYTDWQLFKDSLAYVMKHMRVAYGKEQLVNKLLERVASKNELVRSELLVAKATLAYENNNELKAQDGFSDAYNACKYNKIAFMRLVQLAPDRIPAKMYFEHLRYVVRENPLDQEAALAYAQYSERLELYGLAAGAYRYCADLYQYLNPSSELPAEVFLPWAICCYNSVQHVDQLPEIVSRIRGYNRFNIFLESILARSVLAQGREGEAQALFAAIEQRAEQIIHSGSIEVEGRQLAWYYCFVRPDEDKALEWANQIYSEEPNSVAATSLLSYALIMNDQLEWAKPLALNSNTQIAQISQAVLAIADDDEEKAVALLRQAIVRDPSSFVAEFAKKLLTERGVTYRPQIKSHDILSSLASEFSRFIVPTFKDPNDCVAVRFEIPRKNIDFGESISATVSIVNKSDEPILISEDSLIQGHVQIDAVVRGVLKKDIPALVSEPLFTRKLIGPGKSAVASVRLDRGRLKQMLETHPQAVLDIDFTLRMNVPQADDAEPAPFPMKPVVVSVHRPGAVVTTRGLNNQYAAIVMSDASRRVETGKLFLGLLKEQAVMAEQGPLYHFRYADWMPGRLISAFSSESGLLLMDTYQAWESKTELIVTMKGMALDGRISTALARHLRNPAWPVRMATLSVLSSTHGESFSGVLAWSKKYDTHPLVRRLAEILLVSQAQPSEVPDGLK